MSLESFFKTGKRPNNETAEVSKTTIKTTCWTATLTHTHSTYGTYTLLLLHGNIFLPQTRLWCKKEKKNRLKAIFMHSKCLHHFKKASHRPFCTVTNLNGKKTGKEVFHVELENKMWDVTFLVHFWISHSHFLRCYCLLLWLLLSPPLTHSAKALGTTQKTKYVCTIQITESRNIMCFFSVCFCLFLCFFFVTYYICAEGLECTKNISNLLTHLLHIFKPLLASNSPNKPSARSFVASVSTAQEIHASVASPSI